MHFTRRGDSYLRDIGVNKHSAWTYQKTLAGAWKELQQRTSSCPGDYSYVIFPQHNPRLNLSAARKLGFKPEQVEPAVLYPLTGDTGACSPLLSLIATLEKAEAGQRVLLFAYGSGAGAPPEFAEQSSLGGPYAVAVIELEEGPRIVSQIAGCSLEELSIGAPVQMITRKIYEEEGVIRYGYKFKVVPKN